MFKGIANWLSFQPLDGYRTKILAVVIVVGLNAAVQLGWIDDKMYQWLFSAAVGAGLITASLHKTTSEVKPGG